MLPDEISDPAEPDADSNIENIKSLLDLLPDELSQSADLDVDDDKEFKNDTAQTRKSKKDTIECLIEDFTLNEENHQKAEALCFYHEHTPEEVGKLIEVYDETYEKFFKRKETLTININRLSKLHRGEEDEEDDDKVEEMIS